MGEQVDVHQPVMQQSPIREYEKMCANDHTNVLDEEEEEEEEYEEIMLVEPDGDDGNGEQIEANGEVRMHKSYSPFFLNLVNSIKQIT